jgi:hypothetical protein
MDNSSAVAGVKKGTPYRGKYKAKAKSIDSLLFQAKKLICRIAKVVRVYLVRKNLRLEVGARKLSPDELKVSIGLVS